MASRADRHDAVRPVDVAEEIAAAVRVLSRHRLGAVIVCDPIGAVEGGVVLDARVSRELFVALFVPESLNQLHRGAVIVRGDRVERAGVPFSWTDVVKRAADLDSVASISVDENTGEIRVVDRNGHVELVGPDELPVVVFRRALEAGPR